MPAQLRVEMTGEEAQLFNAIQKVIGQSDKANDSFKRNEKASTEAEKAAVRAAKAQAKSARDGAREVDKLSKKNESLKDSYKRRKAAIEEAGSAGVKSEAEVATAVQQLKREVLDQARAAKQAEAAKQDAAFKSSDAYKQQQAQVTKGVDKVNQLKRATKTLDQQHDELKAAMLAAFKAGDLERADYEQGIRDLGAENERLKAKQNKTFGSEAIGQVVRYAASFVSVTAAVGIVRKALLKLKEDRDNALDIGSTLKDSRTKLRGLSANFSQLETDADQISKDTGLNRVASRDILFTGVSQGLDSQEVALVAKLDPIINALTGVKFAADLGQQFESENLTAEEALNIALTASDTSKFDPNAILPQLQKASIGATVQEASSADTAAFVSVLGAKLDESTGLSVRALFTQFANDKQSRFKDLDGIESVEKFLSLSKVEQKSFINGNKLVTGALKIASESLDQIKQVSAKIRSEVEKSGSEQSAVNREVREAYDPNTREGQLLRSQRSLARAEVENQISTESLAIEAARRKETGLRSDIATRDGSAFGAFQGAVARVHQSGSNLQDDLGRQELLGFTQGVGRSVGEFFGFEYEETLDEQRKQTALLEKMAENSKPEPSNQPLSIPGEDR